MSECNFSPDGNCPKDPKHVFTVEYVGIDAGASATTFRYLLCDLHSEVVKGDINNDPNWIIKE